MATKREELVLKYKQAKAKIEELENKEYDYKINRACDPFGQIQYMDIEDVVKAGASIHDQENSINECIKMYGVTEEDLKDANQRKFLGYIVEEWDNDFKLRVEQIHDERMLEKYQKVADLMSKNFSDDDKFNMDMSEVDALGVSLD